MEAYMQQRLERFFAPRHIAVVGASAKNNWFRNVLENVAQAGFDVRFYPVNPNAEELFGLKTYPSIAALPADTIDFAAIMVKAALVPDALRQLKERGIANVLLLTSGYAETGEEGKRKQRELVDYCREHDILLLGPNCLGFIHPSAQTGVFAGGAVEGKPTLGAIGVVAQSGATSEAMVTKLLGKSLGISLYVTTGNEALLTAEDCLEYLLHEGHTRVITGFFEGFRNIPQLQRVAMEAARRRIPIILIKVGRSAQGVQAAQSHTGALAGNDQVLDGFFRQRGIIRVDSIEELVETAALFARCPLPAGEGLGICTVSGGLCGLYADLCAKHGIALPALDPETIAQLKAVLPKYAQPDNPLDVTGGFLHGLDKVISIFASDPNLDIIAPLSIPPTHPDDSFSHMLNEYFLPLLRASAKPLVAITFKEMSDYAREYYDRHGIPYIEQPELGFRAISHLIEYARYIRGIQHLQMVDTA
jgi:acyl-CoA synthetase (NDP forming)